MSIDARPLVRLYPRQWRDRYGEELLALVGTRVSWPVAVNVIVAGLRMRLEMGGYAPAKFNRMLVNLTGAFIVVMAVLVAAGRSIRLTDAGLFALTWLGFAAVATVLAVAVSSLGWRRRFPRLSRLVVGGGVFSALLATYSYTIDSLDRLSRHSLFVIGLVLTCALLVGVVVESAQLGRRTGFSPSK